MSISGPSFAARSSSESSRSEVYLMEFVVGGRLGHTRNIAITLLHRSPRHKDASSIVMGNARVSRCRRAAAKWHDLAFDDPYMAFASKEVSGER